ncbi:PEPxxWA-CTERM sorting domain-containing protein [Sphingomonas sp. ID1715]|nr:PEPxxWA-CTERM sorting domain-containing protein [Sphingomonas sp. ID1715]
MLGTSAAQADVTDHFNRADALTLGTNYTVQNGNLRIQNNRAITTNFVSLATYDNSISDSASIDVALRGIDAGSYVALSFGFDSANSYFIKVQDNDGDGFFDRYGFDTGNNDLNGVFANLNPFQSGTIRVDVTGTVATLKVFANGGEQTFSADYGYAPGSSTVGFGLNRLGAADNFTFDAVRGGAAVPEPASWALMIAGFGLAGAASRTRRRAALA